jgi:hypothetical protein
MEVGLTVTEVENENYHAKPNLDIKELQCHRSLVFSHALLARRNHTWLIVQFCMKRARFHMKFWEEPYIQMRWVHDITIHHCIVRSVVKISLKELVMAYHGTYLASWAVTVLSLSWNAIAPLCCNDGGVWPWQIVCGGHVRWQHKLSPSFGKG